ncbi:(2Fe-2S)-binding protein [Marinobacterium aestuariivivens]|uniref:(2Fe-2S)-binding protein n=1 Tax=Marinobacterium aestuariivivens TaxID=1698799 RepID=A0ABW2A312_9GAMM
MPSASSFERLPVRDDNWITVRVDGQPVRVRQGDSAATAVLAAGMLPSRTTAVSGSGRAPYCMMGVCFECLFEIDGIENVQGCMTPVKPGMDIRRQQGARHLVSDNAEELSA